MEEEVWKDVVGYEVIYQVSSIGRVKSLERTNIVNGHTQPIRERILKIHLNSTKYLNVGLYSNGCSKTKTVHRLVAEAFIQNPENLATINHKDGNRLNNRVENLEWMSQIDNVRHAIATGLTTPSYIGRFNEKHHMSKKTYQYDLDGVFLREFPSLAEASRVTGAKSCGISICILNPKRLKQVRGFRWSYEKFDIFPPYVA